MIKKLIKDESSIALGLAVTMIVLIGVMDAGLLVFVRNDLEAVIEVNNGQKALDIADSGVQVARQQIQGDKVPAHYDVEEATLCNTDEKDPDDSTDSVKDIQRSPSTENWAPGARGQTRTLAGGEFTVTIQWLVQDSSAPTGCVAPETIATPAAGVDIFKVVSTGQYRNAMRRVESIYETYDVNVPRAYYTPGSITVSRSACVEQVILFSLSDITFNSSGGCSTGTHLKGTDIAYGNWSTPPADKFNKTPRPTADAGAGTAGRITGSSCFRTQDFHGSSVNPTNPEFVQMLSSPQPPSEIAFPFKLDAQPDANRLCDEAKAQKNYEEYTTTGNKSLDSWPTDSSYNTVVCKVFKNIASNNKLTWNVDGNTNLSDPYAGCEGPIQQALW